MTTLELLTKEASQLPPERMGDLLDIARHMREPAQYYSMPQAAHDALQQGLSDYAAGKTLPARDVYAALDAHILS
jgi:predicted transcriptional regulator